MATRTKRWGIDTWGDPDAVWGTGPQPRLPGKPDGPFLIAGNAQVDSHWREPHTGFTEILHYHVEISQATPDDWQRFTVEGHVRFHRFEGLTNGVAARVRVRAINSVGAGEYSDTSTITPMGKLIRIERWRLRASFEHGPVDDQTFNPLNYNWVDITDDCDRFRIRYGAEREIALTTGAIELTRHENGFNATQDRYPDGRMYIELALDEGLGWEIYDFYSGTRDRTTIDLLGLGQRWLDLSPGTAGDTFSLRSLLGDLSSPQADTASETEFTLPTDELSTWSVLRQVVNWFGGSVLDFYGGQSIPEEPARVGTAQVGVAVVGISADVAGPAFACYVPRSAYGRGAVDMFISGSDHVGYGCEGLELVKRDYITHVVGRDGSEAPTIYASTYERNEFRLDTRFGGVTASQVADFLNVQADLYRVTVIAAPVLPPHAVVQVQGQTDPNYQLPPIRGSVLSMLLSSDGRRVNASLSIATAPVPEGSAEVGEGRVGEAVVGQD